MNRRKKREAQCPDENAPAAPVPAGPEPRPQHEYICEGCPRVTKNYYCGVYAFVPPYYIKQGCCYFNRPAPKKKVDVRGRVGQQKTKRMGG
jgi:hypothetical protein